MIAIPSRILEDPGSMQSAWTSKPLRGLDPESQAFFNFIFVELLSMQWFSFVVQLHLLMAFLFRFFLRWKTSLSFRRFVLRISYFSFVSAAAAAAAAAAAPIVLFFA